MSAKLEEWVTAEQIREAQRKGRYESTRTNRFWGKIFGWLWGVELRNTVKRSFIACNRREWSEFTAKILLAETAREGLALVLGYYAARPEEEVNTE